MTEGKLLFVDDEEDLCELFELGFELAGVKVITATSGQAALDLVKKDLDSNIRVILTDLGMSDGDGWTLMRHVSELRPDIRVVVITGETGSPIKKAHELTKSGQLTAVFDKGRHKRDDIIAECQRLMGA